MKKALSLVEVCIAIVVTVIILASMVRIFGQGYKYLRKNRVNTVVYNLARQFSEKYSDWGELVSLTGSDPPTNGTYTDDPAVPAPTDPLEPITLNNVTYTPTLTIDNGPCPPTMPGCPPNDVLKRLDITISWQEDGKNKSFTLTTLKANY